MNVELNQNTSNIQGPCDGMFFLNAITIHIKH